MVFVGYPYLKRLTPLCHLGVGLGLALSPLGGFLGVAGSLRGLEQVLPLFAFALCWVAGFDIIYATLDEAHDRAYGVCSLPATLGTGGGPAGLGRPAPGGLRSTRPGGR